MNRESKLKSHRELYFVTFTVIDNIDLFIRNEYRQVLIENIQYCQQNRGLDVYAYCFMTSQIHLIIGASKHFRIQGIVRDVKAFSSKCIRRTLENMNEADESRKKWMLAKMYKEGIDNPNNRDFQLWQQYAQSIALTSRKMIDQRLEYIHQNPVAAGFVEQAEEWVYSSARDYAGIGKGRIELVLLS